MMMMMRRASCALVGALMVLAAAACGQGDMGGADMEGGDMMGEDTGLKSWHEEQVAEIETMRDKFLALAEAFPEETWDWRPMEGVRSVREVMSLIVAEGYLFPQLWDVDAPEGVETGFEDEMNRVGAMSKADAIEEMGKAFAHMIEACSDLGHEKAMAEADWFGRKVIVTTAIGLSAGDMHEHLGQAIAYARTNHIVPPWSAGGN